MFLKLVASFAPWLAFLLIARDTVARVEIGLLTGLALAVVMAVLKVNRGIIMWVSLVFFAAATAAVVLAHNMWTVRHMGVLANGALALAAWGGLLLGRPFTLEYARAQTDPSVWRQPLFLRVNRLLTAVWASSFTVNTAIAAAQQHGLWPSWLGLLVSNAVLIGTAGFTSWYPGHVRRSRGSGETPLSGEGGTPGGVHVR